MIKPANTFHIAFDMKRYPGKIVATTVQLTETISSDPKDSFRVDLSDHPLYPRLVEYVLRNPVRSEP